VETHDHDSPEDEVNIGMIAITPSTGDVIWDEFHGMNNKYPPEIADNKASRHRHAR
jgi:hypothetical protein